MKTKRTCTLILLVILIVTPLIPSYVIAWDQETSNNLANPGFTTHQWLGYEAIELFSTEGKVAWIYNNLLDFWHGIEAPYNRLAAENYVDDIEIYEDIQELVLYLDATGTTVTNDALAARALEEYNKLVVELSRDEIDAGQAAFYAGTMAHYVSQAGTWGAIWDESLWGPMNNLHYVLFEKIINYGCDANSFQDSQSDWRHNYLEIDTDIISYSPETAYNATIGLAKGVFPIAQDLHDNFNASATSVAGWTENYKNITEICLSYSVEAIASALEGAMTKTNWKYLRLVEPSFSYDNDTSHLEIPAFDAEYIDNSGSHNITDSLAEIAEYHLIVYETNAYGMPIEPRTTGQNGTLSYSAGQWYLSSTFLKGTLANSYHSILYHFRINGSIATWSNATEDRFYVEYFSLNVTQPTISYDSQERALSITNITASTPEIAEIGIIEPGEVNMNNWFVYQRAEGSAIENPLGVPAIDTENNRIRGTLQFNYTDQTWYSLNNDIGWLYSQRGQLYYVIVRFNLTEIPVGYLRQSPSGGQPVFYRYFESPRSELFVTRDHQITISKPELIFNQETQYISFYGVTAYTDYQNLTLDYYEIHLKPIPQGMTDTRSAVWKVFLYDPKNPFGGIASSKTGPLLWDSTSETWYEEDIWVGSLPDNDYYVSCKITNMNVNSSVSSWGPASELFQIKRKTPVVYFILPEFFLAGFLVLFGWVAWYRPKRKKEKRDAEYQRRVESGEYKFD